MNIQQLFETCDSNEYLGIIQAVYEEVHKREAWGIVYNVIGPYSKTESLITG